MRNHTLVGKEHPGLTLPGSILGASVALLLLMFV